MVHKPVCSFCRQTGKNGAQWILKWAEESHQVHRPCGEKLREYAPEGASVKLVLDEKLREQLDAQDRENRAREFWKSKGLSKEALGLVPRTAAARTQAA